MPGMPGAHEPWNSRRSRRPIRDAIELLAREIARGDNVALGDIRATILLPPSAWAALQNAAIVEGRIGRRQQDEFIYAGVLFRIERP